MTLQGATIFEQVQATLAAGLVRHASTTCGRWAQNYMILGKPIPGPLRFKYHPWSHDWYDENGSWVGMKAAQMGMSAAAIARAIFTIDIKRIDVLYVLPKRTPDATDFSKSKFDPIVESSPYLSTLFSNVKNIGHKQAGTVNLFIRGSRSRSALKAISIGLSIYDEYDEMNQTNLILADERSSGYSEEDKQNIRLSTPTVPDYGISAAIKETTQEHYVFRCPICSRFTHLEFPDSLIVVPNPVTNSYIKCSECHNPLSHESKPEYLAHRLDGGTGHWVSTATSDLRGFMIPQLYSCLMPPWKIAKLAIEAQESKPKEQELWNSKGGLPHIVAGAKVNDFSAVLGTHFNHTIPEAGLITMGIDVGKKIHYQISQWMLPESPGSDLNTHAIKRVVAIGTLSDFEQLDPLIYNYQVLHAVIDANPETRKAQEFADRFSGHVHLCYFTRFNSPKTLRIPTSTTVQVRRTPWLDLSQGRFLRAAIILPQDTPNEYKNHISALVRVDEFDSDGNPVVHYISTAADHFAFANLYDEIALPLAVSQSQNQDIDVFL